MDFWQTILVLVRRWYVAVPAFLATLGLAALSYSYVPAQYESGAVLALTTPLTGGTQVIKKDVPRSETNPLMNFEHSLNLAGAVVIQEMNSAEVAASLGVTPHGPVEYEVSNGSTNPELLQTGPFLFVQGTGPTATAAETITERVVRRAEDVLVQRQRALDAPASTHIEVQRVVQVTQGQLLDGSAKRAAAAALALGLLASLFAVYGVESFARRARPQPVDAPAWTR